MSNHRYQHCLSFVQAYINENIRSPCYWSFLRGLHGCTEDSSHKEPATPEMFPCNDIIMELTTLHHLVQWGLDNARFVSFSTDQAKWHPRVMHFTGLHITVTSYEHTDVSNHQHLLCLIVYSEIFQRKHQVSVLLILSEGNPLVPWAFTSQRASNTRHVSVLLHYNGAKPISSYSIGMDWTEPGLCITVTSHEHTSVSNHRYKNCMFIICSGLYQWKSSPGIVPFWWETTSGERIHHTKGQQHRKCFRVMTL